MSGILKLSNARQKGVNETTPNYRQQINPKNRNAILSEPSRKRSNAVEILNVGTDSSKRYKPSTSQMKRGSSNGGHRSSEGNLPTTTPIRKPLGPSNGGHRSSDGNLPTTTPIRKKLASSNGGHRSSEVNVSTTIPSRQQLGSSNGVHRSSQGNLPSTPPIRQTLELMNMHGPNSSRKKNTREEDIIYNGTNQVDMFMEEKENEVNIEELSQQELAVMTYKMVEKSTKMVEKSMKMVEKSMKMMENFEKDNNENFQMVFDIMKAQVKEKGTGNANTDTPFPFHETFINKFPVNLNGQIVKLDAIEGGRKEIGRLVYQMQDACKSPSIYGKSLKEDIRSKFLPVIFQLIDWPTKVAYAVSQYLWPKDHFATHYLTSFNEGLGKTSDEKLSIIPADEKNLFLEIMLYCGGYLIERHKDADGNLVKGNNWIKWANYGRENLHNRGHQMQKGISSISWWIKEDTVPLFSRNGIQLANLPDMVEDEGLENEEFIQQQNDRELMPEEEVWPEQESDGEDGMNEEDREAYAIMMDNRQELENMVQEGRNAANRLNESREEGELSSYGGPSNPQTDVSRTSSLSTNARARRSNLKHHNYTQMHTRGIQEDEDEMGGDFY